MVAHCVHPALPGHSWWLHDTLLCQVGQTSARSRELLCSSLNIYVHVALFFSGNEHESLVLHVTTV